jgi:signal transduction histidine kinase/CheY-like chemotaxis protein
VIPTWLGVRPIRLRGLALIAAAGVVAYLASFAIYLAFSLAPRAERLRQDTRPVLEIFEELSSRTGRLERAVGDARRVIAGNDSSAIDSLHTFLLETGGVRATPYAYAPDTLRLLLGRSELLGSSIETKLHEMVANLELDRREAAARLLDRVDSIHGEMTQVLVDAERVGLNELTTREAALGLAVETAVRTATWWAVLSVVLVLLLLLSVARLVQRPLARLEEGLELVARGDLNARVEVQRDDEIGGLAAHFNEMTSVLRARAEEQGRFAAAGQLIAGVAHEVNNPLMAIASVTDTRLEDTDLGEELRAELLQIRRQARRAGKLLSGLLRFVRSDAPPSTSIDLNAVLRSATDLVSYRFGVEEITLVERLDPALPPALGAAGRLEQVFVNLLSNAADAMVQAPGRRLLRIETWAEDGQVYAAVGDTGPGVAPAMRPRLFHPFATTKGASGTGLGLYISRQIVREAGGELRFEPAPGETRFVVRMPAAPVPAPLPVATAPVVAAGNGAGLAGARILVVDDEDAVRGPIVRYLRRRGAVVFEARDGQEGYEGALRETPDAIIADLRMPRLDGAGLYAALRAERPDLADRTIILSGDLSQLGAAFPVPETRVLVKPAELREIEIAVLAVTRG